MEEEAKNEGNDIPLKKCRYSCRYCKKKGLSLSARWEHEFKKHPEKFEAKKNRRDDKKRVECDECSKKFTRASEKNRHKRKYHPQIPLGAEKLVVVEGNLALKVSCEVSTQANI